MNTLNNVRLERAPGQVVRIELSSNANPNMTVGQLFWDGPIEVLVMHSWEGMTRLLVTTPYSLSVVPVNIGLAGETQGDDRLV